MREDEEEGVVGKRTGGRGGREIGRRGRKEEVGGRGR